jgi:3-phenylpropionate/trans-cinnamate dioxygenase ferredoxin component
MTDTETVTGTRWVRACAVDDLDDEEGLRVETVPPIALFRVDGEVLCIDDSCTHETYSLAEGWLEGCAVECPLHQAKFDLRTGRPSPPAMIPVRVHAVRISDGYVEVDVPADYRAPS